MQSNDSQCKNNSNREQTRCNYMRNTKISNIPCIFNFIPFVNKFFIIFFTIFGILLPIGIETQLQSNYAFAEINSQMTNDPFEYTDEGRISSYSSSPETKSTSSVKNPFASDAGSGDPFALLYTLSILSEVAFVGDIGTGTNGIKTIDALLAENPDLVVFLGDMGYSSSTTIFANQVNRLRNAGIDVMCAIGNHDSDEDESDTTELKYWNLCSGGTIGQGFWKVLDGQLTVVGVNTQCDGNSGHSRASCDKTTISNYLSTVPKDNSVIITSHKPFCETPLSKHTAFSCTSALNTEFNRLHELRVAAHSHCMAWKLGENKVLSGGGGRSHYDCSGSTWWINDNTYGYLLMMKKNTYLDFVFKNQALKEISQHFKFYYSIYHYEPFFTATGSNFYERPDSSSLDLPSSFTVAAWFNTNKDYTNDGFIVNKGGLGPETAGENLNYGIWIASDEKIKSGFETSTGANNWATSPNTYNDGKWHYAVGVFDDAANTVKLYIDGKLVTSKSSVASVPETNLKPFRVGANAQSNTNYFTGQIDEVRVWKNIALTGQQVADSYDGLFQSVPAPVLFLPF